jgi:hypothetical protein
MTSSVPVATTGLASGWSGVPVNTVTRHPGAAPVTTTERAQSNSGATSRGGPGGSVAVDTSTTTSAGSGGTAPHSVTEIRTAAVSAGRSGRNTVAVSPETPIEPSGVTVCG